MTTTTTTTLLRRVYWGGELVPKTSIARRHEATFKDFVEFVKDNFKKKPALRSALMGVAQYWADEANDAVHSSVVFSTRSTPLWPHPCRWDGAGNEREADSTEMCSLCADRTSGRMGYMRFDDNGSGIVAFQSCCREDASQDSSTSEAYLPYAIARRVKAAKPSKVSKAKPKKKKTSAKTKAKPKSADFGIEIEIIGGPIRAWLENAEPEGGFYGDEEDDNNEDDDEPASKKKKAGSKGAKAAEATVDATTKKLFDLVYDADSDDDGPRAVLADHLQQKGDPLGEYITLALNEGVASERLTELEAQHGPTWLGPIAEVTPPEHVVFDRGFVKSAAVYFADAKIATSNVTAREWGTVEDLRFLLQSEQRLSPKTMRSLRSIGPLDAKGLAAILEADDNNFPRLESVHVSLSSTKMLGSLAELDIASLRCLTISSTAGGPGSSRGRSGRNPFTGESMEMPAQLTSTPHLSPPLLASMMKSPSYKRLDELVLATINPKAIEAWLTLDKKQRPPAITFTGFSPSLEPRGFRMSVAKSAAIVDMPSLNADIAMSDLEAMIRALPKDVKTIDVKDTRFFTALDSDLASLSKGSGRKVTRWRNE